MPDLTVPFGQLLEDDPAFQSPGVTRAVNVIPRSESFGPVKQLVPITNALTARARGAISARDSSDNVFVYAGDETKLYESVNNSFTDESKGGGYSTADSDNWEFAQWTANNKIIATNFTDPVQSITIGGGASGAFADMITSTNKPKAKHIGIVNRFVVLGFTNDTTDGEKPNRVWWSAIDGETDFDPDAATQSDFEDLATGGIVQRVIGGTEYGLIFQQNMVRTMRYVGEGVIFELLPLNFAPGTPIPGSVVAYKGNVFYIAEDGFMRLSGTTVDHLGDRRVDRAFWNSFDPGNKRFVSAAVDPLNKIVAWAFPGEGATDLPNKILYCKYDEKKWAEADIETEMLLSTETQGFTLDGLDALGSDIDDASVFDESLDSDKWKGGAFRFAAFDRDHKMNFFTGSPLTAIVESADLQPAPGQRWQASGIEVYVDGGNARASVAVKDRLTDGISYDVGSEMNAQGVCPIRTEGRFQRVRISLSGSWSHLQGMNIPYILRGAR